MKLSYVAGLSLAVFGALAPAGTAQAQTYPPTASNGQVSDTSVRPGECVTFSGTGFVPGTPVAVTDNDSPVSTVNADPGGTFAAQVCPEVLGVHILRGTGTGTDGGQRVVSAVVNVLGAAAGLSETGSSDTVPMALVGAGLVAAGTAAVLVTSRRRRAVPAV